MPDSASIDSSFAIERIRVDGALRDTVAAAQQHGDWHEEHLGDWRYRRLSDTFQRLPEGSVVFDDTLICGYPKIGRIFRLDAGLRAQFEHPCWVEEKIDGYNVRIFQHEGQVLALTRRGYICPFTTDRVPDLLDIRVFESEPELVLCAEVAGPENPYNEGGPPDIHEDIRLFVFDMMRKNQPGFLPHREKLRLLDAHALPGVPQYGRCEPDQAARLKPLVLALDRAGREGIIFKEDSGQDRRAKYVTGRINVADIRLCSAAIKQLPAEYFTQRVLRLALFLDEHGIAPTPDIERELGAALLEGMSDAIHQEHDTRKVIRRFRCRFLRKRNIRLFLRSLHHLLGKGSVRTRCLSREGAYYVLQFEKVLPRTTGLLAHLLRGGIVFD
jgi:putative ATP-dependent DNA ligase